MFAPTTPPNSAFRPAAISALVLATLIGATGCAKGVFWRLGRFSPKVVEQWEQEEKIANSVFERKRQMQQLASDALAAGGAELNRAARELGQTAISEPVLVNRVEAVRQLSRLNCPVAWDALRRAGLDPEPEVRLAVVKSWQGMSAEQAVPALTSTFASDASVDVRLAAVRGLGHFPGQPARESLRTALNDADPAIQLRATQSLARVTGESFGPDVRAWTSYLGPPVAPEALPGETRQADASAPSGESAKR